MNIKPQPKSPDMRGTAHRMVLWRFVTGLYGRVNSGLGTEFQ